MDSHNTFRFTPRLNNRCKLNLPLSISLSSIFPSPETGLVLKWTPHLTPLMPLAVAFSFKRADIIWVLGLFKGDREKEKREASRQIKHKAADEIRR